MLTAAPLGSYRQQIEHRMESFKALAVTTCYPKLHKRRLPAWVPHRCPLPSISVDIIYRAQLKIVTQSDYELFYSMSLTNLGFALEMVSIS